MGGGEPVKPSEPKVTEKQADFCQTSGQLTSGQRALQPDCSQLLLASGAEGLSQVKYALMMIWWWYDDDMRMIWWWYDDYMMMIWWFYDEDMMIIWWWYDDDMMMIWWWYDDDMMMFMINFSNPHTKYCLLWLFFYLQVSGIGTGMGMGIKDPDLVRRNLHPHKNPKNVYFFFILQPSTNESYLAFQVGREAAGGCSNGWASIIQLTSPFSILSLDPSPFTPKQRKTNSAFAGIFSPAANVRWTPVVHHWWGRTAIPLAANQPARGENKIFSQFSQFSYSPN